MGRDRVREQGSRRQDHHQRFYGAVALEGDARDSLFHAVARGDPTVVHLDVPLFMIAVGKGEVTAWCAQEPLAGIGALERDAGREMQGDTQPMGSLGLETVRDGERSRRTVPRERALDQCALVTVV